MSSTAIAYLLWCKRIATCASFLRIRNATRNMLNMSLSRLLMRVACDAVTLLDHVKLQCHASQSYARLRRERAGLQSCKNCDYSRTLRRLDIFNVTKL